MFSFFHKFCKFDCTVFNETNLPFFHRKVSKEIIYNELIKGSQKAKV